MTSVQVPSEFCETPKITTEDISVLPYGGQGRGFKDRLQGALNSALDLATSGSSKSGADEAI